MQLEISSYLLEKFFLRIKYSFLKEPQRGNPAPFKRSKYNAKGIFRARITHMVAQTWSFIQV